MKNLSLNKQKEAQKITSKLPNKNWAIHTKFIELIKKVRVMF
jgi:hypothetical protein